MKTHARLYDFCPSKGNYIVKLTFRHFLDFTNSVRSKGNCTVKLVFVQQSHRGLRQGPPSQNDTTKSPQFRSVRIWPGLHPSPTHHVGSSNTQHPPLAPLQRSCTTTSASNRFKLSDSVIWGPANPIIWLQASAPLLQTLLTQAPQTHVCCLEIASSAPCLLVSLWL